MAASGPGSLPPDYTHSAGTTAGGAFHGSVLHVNIQDELQALWTKFGLGTTNPTPAANTALIALAANVSRWDKSIKSQLVSGSGSNLTTTSVTLVDLDAATMSTSYVSSGGTLLVFVFSTVLNSATAGDYTQIGVSINGTDVPGTSYSPSTSGFRGLAMAVGRATPAAGTYTIKPRFRTSTATTTTATSVGGERFMLILELVTGS